MGEDFRKKLKDYTEGKLCKEEPSFNWKKQRRILRACKWKARMQNAFTVIGILAVIIFITSIITALYYKYGQQNRSEIYENVIQATIAATEPNMKLNFCTNSIGMFFNSTCRGQLEKNVGSQYINAGEIEVEFWLGHTGHTEKTEVLNDSQEPLFFYPNSDNSSYIEGQWKELEKLPEGTVVEAYISFDKFYEASEILEKLSGKQAKPIWFAVDTGFEKNDINKKQSIIYPIGLPYDKEGDIDDKFINTLKLLKKYEPIASKVAAMPSLDIQRRIDYINANGVKIYGIVVTGPSKEILKLKREQWVKGIKVGQVALWNWNE